MGWKWFVALSEGGETRQIRNAQWISTYYTQIGWTKKYQSLNMQHFTHYSFHSSLAKAHISPKTVHSFFKTKFLSHINSQSHQNAKNPSQLLWLISPNRPDVLNTLGAFAKITWMVQHGTMVICKSSYLSQLFTHASKLNSFLI